LKDLGTPWTILNRMAIFQTKISTQNIQNTKLA
jgi:hypothetical protein